MPYVEALARRYRIAHLTSSICAGHTYCGPQPIVDGRDHEAVAGQSGFNRRETTQRTRIAAFPPASVDKDCDRAGRGSALRRPDVHGQRHASDGAVGNDCARGPWR